MKERKRARRERAETGLTNNEGHRGLHVAGEGQGTHGYVGTLPAEGEEDGAKSLSDRGQEGRLGGGESHFLLCEEEEVKGEQNVGVQSSQQTPVG